MPARHSSRPPQARAVDDPLVGRVLGGKFTIEALIARGAMGKVYRATQSSLGRTCAIKVLTAPEGEDADGEFHQRFLREASIGAKLTHPNTVTIFDYGVEGELFYIAMELLEGRTLARMLREEGPLDEARATQIARQICRSLREAHTLGVVHRDLKPANVFLVTRADEGDVVKVLDFGLVKRVEASPDDDLTQAGVFVGSPKYMAPEQIRGEHVDGRADVYALGTMLYEMLVGHVPFERPKPVDTLLAQVNARVPPMRDKRRDLELDPRTEALVLRCLEKNPDDRFGSMEELLSALKLSTGAMTGTQLSLEALRATGAFGAYGTHSSRPPPLSISGEIPAAATSHAPPALSVAPRARSRWVPLALFGVALATVAGVVALRRHDRVTNASAASTPTVPVSSAPAAPVAAPATSTATVLVASAVPAANAVTAAPTETPVSIDSEPSGARIRDPQRAILCDATPCTLRVGKDGLTVVVDAKGHVDETVKLSQGDPPRVVKLTKSPTWRPAAPATAAAKTAAPPPVDNGFKGDPY